MIKTFVLLFAVSVGVIGCRHQQATNNGQSHSGGHNAQYAVGILDAQGLGDAVVLQVVLKDEAKLRLLIGDTPAGDYWTCAAYSPTSVRIGLDDGKLSIGEGSSSFSRPVQEPIQFIAMFPQITPGATELEIGTAVRDGQTIPVRARLVPTTEGEKKAINN